MCALLENLFSRCLNALYLERFRMLTPFRKRVSWFFARHSSDAKNVWKCYRVSSPEIDVKLWRLKPKWPYNCCCRKPSVQIKLSSMNGVYFSLHTLKLLPGEWGLIPEMIQVCDQYILIVLIELNTLIYDHICETSQRVANSRVRALWSWKFWRKKNCVFSQLGALEHRSRA